MVEEISLKNVERKIYSTASQDGMSDIFLGCIFLIFAIAPLLSSKLGDFWSSAIFVPFWGIVMLCIWLVRKHVIRPRIGEVKFGAARRTRLLRFNLIMLTANFLIFILGIWKSFNSEVLSGRTTSALFGLSCLLLFCIAAYFLNFGRLYVYGLLIGLSPLVGEWLYTYQGASHHGFPITFGISAGIMIFTGLVVFIRIFRLNPIPAQGS